MVYVLVADSSSIISLALNCLAPVLGELDVDIVVPEGVYDEIVTRPLKSKRFALESLRIKRLFTDEVIREVDADEGLTKAIIDGSNNLFFHNNKALSIMHKGEAEAIALALEHRCHALLIDERTARLLIENPHRLASVLSSRNKHPVCVDEKQLVAFQKTLPPVAVIRSTEIAAAAFERGILSRYLRHSQPDLLLAALAALKYSGCSISWEEIDDYTRLLTPAVS